MTKKKYDFAGWATKYNIRCADGRIIKHDAFKHLHNAVVPLVWNHEHNTPENIIGNAVLEHREEGVYAYGNFNETETGQIAKNLVVHGDITSLSIYANKLSQSGTNVTHGEIRELSLVLAGANPGASIQEVLAHSDNGDIEATIYNNETIELYHSEDANDDTEDTEKLTHADDDEETVGDIYNSMSEKQKRVVAYMVSQLAEDEENEDEEENQNEGEDQMKHNVFDNKPQGNDEIKHSEILAAAMADAKKYGSLKESIIAHAGTYGINDIDTLFPPEHVVSNEPEFISRDQSWVAEFFNATKKSPFSRLKAIYADITADEARAKGYVTGNKKVEEVFGLLKRTTTPQTIYKKQKLDRDDIIDITNFDVVAWMKKEMRMMLMEEIARAILIGDGRSSLSADKIKEANIRPIFNDDDLYTIKAAIGTGADKAKELIKTVIKSRTTYEGTGVPNLYVEPGLLADMLLIEDEDGRFIYPDVTALCKTLRVNKIVEVPLMAGLERDAADGRTHKVMGIIVNPSDYTVGADKGGAVSMFDDFDIDYNQYKYLLETRMSGSLLKPKTAITIEEVI